MNEGFLRAADGSRLYFQQYGRGGDVLLVPNGIVYAGKWQSFAGERTVVFYDVRNRGRSDAVGDVAALAAGIHNDVADLELVRQHFAAERVSLLAHSYPGLMVLLYAAAHPGNVARVVSVGAPPPSATKVYSDDLSWHDGVYAEVMAAVAAFQQAPQPPDPEERCRAFWSILRPLFVADQSHASQIDWGRCDLANERGAFAYLHRFVFPSLQALSLHAADFAQLTAPVLLVHGRRDRSAPVGGALDWAALLPNARVLLLDAGHAPWIERAADFFPHVRAFLEG